MKVEYVKDQFRPKLISFKMTVTIFASAFSLLHNTRPPAASDIGTYMYKGLVGHTHKKGKSIKISENNLSDKSTPPEHSVF